MIKPSDLKKQAEELIQAGQMPKLEDLLQAVAEVRGKYKKKIEDAQTPDVTAGAAALGNS
jgi:hypothetical protein